MELLFAHLGRRVAAGQLGAAWGTALGAFEAHLLAVPRSKFTQYALWFLADKARPPCAAAPPPFLPRCGGMGEGDAQVLSDSSSAPRHHVLLWLYFLSSAGERLL